MTFFESATYSLARIGLQRGIGLVLLIAFLNAVNQFRPLLGDHGLLPVSFFVKQVPFRESPSLFYLLPHDVAFITAAWIGVFLSCLAVTGLSERFTPWISIIVWAMLWTLYISFVNVGQDFYAFGWESILLEAGFYAIFLGSRSTHASDRRHLALPLAGVSRDVRRRIDQAARRSLLARSHLPQLLLRNPAHAESAELVFSLRARMDTHRRRGLQSFLRADRSVRLFPAAADQLPSPV